MTDRPRRILLLVTVGLVVWYGLVLGAWALRSLSDTVPGTVPAATKEAPKARAATTVELSCGTLFSPDDVAPPSTPAGLELDREPCDLVVSDARRVFAIDTLVLVLGLAAVVVVRRRLARTPDDTPAHAAA